MLSPFLLTIELATITTAILLIIGTPIAMWLARKNTIPRLLIESVVTLPLVLPPTVLGFYMLVLFGSNGAVGRAVENLGLPPLIFSFPGLVVGSVIYSLPFAIQPIQNAITQINKSLLEVSAVMGASKIDQFFSIILPLSRRGFVTAAILSFAHTIGEFGVVLMIGGSIPGKTEVLSIAIYNEVEALNYSAAHAMSAWLLIFSFAILFFLSVYNRKSKAMF